MTEPTVVQVVGAGPGDPGLLSRRAARLLVEADVVVADRPSMSAIVDLARPGATVHYVGRTEHHPALPTHEIVTLLAGDARAGLRVVRLKAGDPFVCSRGAEEVAGLAAEGIACVVTPGVTSATAGPLAARARRGRTVTIASGDDDGVSAPVPWADVAADLTDGDGSLVVLIGRAHQGSIAADLVAAGVDPNRRVDVVHRAGRTGTRMVEAALADLGATRLPPPALFVVEARAAGPDGPEGERGDAHP